MRLLNESCWPDTSSTRSWGANPIETVSKGFIVQVSSTYEPGGFNYLCSTDGDTSSLGSTNNWSSEIILILSCLNLILLKGPYAIYFYEQLLRKVSMKKASQVPLSGLSLTSFSYQPLSFLDWLLILTEGKINHIVINTHTYISDTETQPQKLRESLH